MIDMKGKKEKRLHPANFVWCVSETNLIEFGFNDICVTTRNPKIEWISEIRYCKKCII